MLIAQITDTHIVEKDRHWLSEPLTETNERLIRVVAHLNQMNPQPDVVILTGDASDTGTEAAYTHLKELLSRLKIPVYVIPGNHDCREEMRKAFTSYMPSKGFLHYVIDNYPIRLICLDTHVEGKDHGYICEERSAWLEKTLQKGSEKPTLIFMHHPLSKVGHKLFDNMLCFTPPHFKQIMSKQHQLLGFISGHYHHLCTTSYAGKPCFIAPSVAPVHYFAHSQDDDVAALELEDPAITLHQWFGEDAITSHVIRIKKHHQRIDWKLIKSRI